MTPAYIQAVFDAHGIKLTPEQAAAYAAAQAALMKTAQSGYAALAMEAEPSGYTVVQRRTGP
jgi:hypothetical protein